jgi:hypothetical protein
VDRACAGFRISAAAPAFISVRTTSRGWRQTTTPPARARWRHRARPAHRRRFKCREQQPAPVTLLQHLQRVCQGVDEPDVANTCGRVEGQLARSSPAVDGESTSQSQSGASVKKLSSPHEREPFPAPTRQVWHQHVSSQVELGLEQDEPVRSFIAEPEPRASAPNGPTVAVP